MELEVAGIAATVSAISIAFFLFGLLVGLKLASRFSPQDIDFKASSPELDQDLVEVPDPRARFETLDMASDYTNPGLDHTREVLREDLAKLSTTVEDVPNSHTAATARKAKQDSRLNLDQQEDDVVTLNFDDLAAQGLVEEVLDVAQETNMQTDIPDIPSHLTKSRR